MIFTKTTRSLCEVFTANPRKLAGGVEMKTLYYVSQRHVSFPDPHGDQSRKGCKSISVVTGRGNHSRGGKARIKPAIVEYLKKHNYR